MNGKQKLSLKKERIAHLTKSEMRTVVGGSTNHGFTCSWCLKLSAQYKKNKPVSLN